MKLQHNNKHLHDCNSGLVGQQFTRIWSFDQVFNPRIEWRREAPPLNSWVVISSIFGALCLIKREFEIAICIVRSKPQIAKNGKNRLAILTIFRFRRTDA